MKIKYDGQASSKTTTASTKTLSNIKPSNYSTLIQDCISSSSFELGKSIHAQMVSVGYTPDTYLQTKIIMLYARSGGVDDLCYARVLFDNMRERNSTTWNTMILGYAHVGNHTEVVKLFFRMHRSGFVLDKFTFPSVIKAFKAMGEIHGFSQVQTLIIKTGLNHDLVVGGTLVDGYTEFGLVDDAIIAFNEIKEKNVIIWNIIFSGYLKEIRWEEAWRFFHKMQTLGFHPDKFTFATALRICSSLSSPSRGTQVHAKLIVYGFEGDIFVGNSLVHMYSRCNDYDSCLKVFDEMEEKDQVTWNSIISAKAHFGHFSESLMLFSRMCSMGFKSDRFNLGSILMASAGLSDIKTGRELHCHLLRNSLDSDVVLGSALVDLYSKCGLVQEAFKVFERLPERNEVSFNALIAGYVHEREAEKALELYHNMRMEVNVDPDQFTFTTLLTLCTDYENHYHGKSIHAHLMRTNQMQNMVIETELVHMYTTCGMMQYAQEIFDRMLEKNAYSWNSMIEGYEQNEQIEEALQLFQRMQIQGIRPDAFSLASILSIITTLCEAIKGKEIHGFMVRHSMEKEEILRVMLLDVYAKCGVMDYASKIYYRSVTKDVTLHNVMISAFASSSRLNDAKNLFDKMEERNTVSWNCLIGGYAKSGYNKESVGLFRKMLEENVELNSLTILTMVNLCGDLACLYQGEKLHGLIIKKGFENSSVVLATSLIDMYAKCGAIKKARRVFDYMNETNIISWNAMINGYSKHGVSEESLLLYEQMQRKGIYPNGVTFLSVLSACSHTGLIEEGLTIFISMVENYRIEPSVEHYTCMVDLLGRAGLLEEAMEVIKKMPIKPEISTFGALLAACRLHNSVEMGKLAAKELFVLDPQNSGHYVLLSNIYAAEGNWKEVENIRKLMKEKGVRKEPGISWIMINNEKHVFHAGSKSHSRTEEIYIILRDLTVRMKKLGYIPDAHFILRNVNDVSKEKEEHLLQHSERLAIGLGLISLPENFIITVFKNLRICGDCHTTIKLISKITGRQIIVRDLNRFHHFENGECSCGDYW